MYVCTSYSVAQPRERESAPRRKGAGTSLEPLVSFLAATSSTPEMGGRGQEQLARRLSFSTTQRAPSICRRHTHLPCTAGWIRGALTLHQAHHHHLSKLTYLRKLRPYLPRRERGAVVPTKQSDYYSTVHHTTLLYRRSGGLDNEV